MRPFKLSVRIIFYNMVKGKRLGLWSHKDMVSFTQSTNKAQKNKKCKLVQPLWRTVWRFLKKLEIELLYNPAIPLLGIHTKETKIERDTCTPVLIAALFTISRTWKQPRYASADERVRKLIHSGILLSY